MEREFYTKLIRLLFESLKNNYTDNYDEERFGQLKRQRFSVVSKVKNKIKKKFIEGKYVGQLDISRILERIDAVLTTHSVNIEKVYDILANSESKNIYLNVLAYRILGPKFIKLPINNSIYLETKKKIELLKDNTKTIDPLFLHFMLYYYDLNVLDIPVKIFFSTSGIYSTFVTQQYRYNKLPFIQVKAGDYVIDGGACWGDTAIYFANKVGDKGKVFSFEFIKENVNIIEKNLSLNPILSDRITIVENPLWDKTDIVLNFESKGPSSSFLQDSISNLQFKTITIDDFVTKNNIPKIDFIKMDIEGAEMYALKGAEQTIRKFKPVLAISIYHTLSDFSTIPLWIDNLNLGYKLYVDHYTIHLEETVLFATIVI